MFTTLVSVHGIHYGVEPLAQLKLYISISTARDTYLNLRFLWLVGLIVDCAPTALIGDSAESAATS